MGYTVSLVTFLFSCLSQASQVIVLSDSRCHVYHYTCGGIYTVNIKHFSLFIFPLFFKIIFLFLVFVDLVLVFLVVLGGEGVVGFF